jgi:hypothetical protein
LEIKKVNPKLSVLDPVNISRRIELFREGFFDILVGNQPSNGHDKKYDSRK